MFLNVLRRRNPAFVEAAIALHRAGAIAPATYVIDLDAVERNAGLIADEASRLGLTVFAMTKQVGRPASFCRAVMRGGIDAGVAVDMACARALTAAGMPVGHIGHLVQVPGSLAGEAAAMEPANWTVFDDAKAGQAAAASAAHGREQPLLARIVAPGDTFYRNHEGGFAADTVLRVADRLDALEGARFAGVTTFPAILYDHESGRVRPTQNLATLERAAAELGHAGRTAVAVNAPGTTASGVLGMLADAGATQVEPGHGLTGTCPQHAAGEEPELPAILYLTEVSHHHGGQAYCVGGGFYIDPVFPEYQVRALVAASPDPDATQVVNAEIPPPSAIDYHAMLDQPDGELPSGATVVFGFRPQVFFTRAAVVGIRGVASGQPSVETNSPTT